MSAFVLQDKSNKLVKETQVIYFDEKRTTCIRKGDGNLYPPRMKRASLTRVVAVAGERKMMLEMDEKLQRD